MKAQEMIEKLQKAQAFIYELLDNPALDSEANSSLYCADNCLGEAVQYLRDSSKPLGTIYFKYFDPFIGGYREDQTPLIANESPEYTARACLSSHFHYKVRKLQFVKIEFIQGA